MKETPDGIQRVFSLKFVKKNGELVFFPRAVACGINMNMKATRMRGFLPVDVELEKTGHPTPVSIDAIIVFNGQKVVL